MRFLFLLPLLAAAFAWPAPAPAQDAQASAKIQPQMLKALNARRADPVAKVRTRILVTLKPPAQMTTTARDYKSAAGMAAIQSQVKLMQDRVLERNLGGQYQELYRYQSFFGFSAFADDDAIMAMASLPEVERIEEMPVYYKTSSQSHPLAGVTAMHARGFTGQGVTIAIIDDGIDHDHPAFGGFTAFPNAKILGGRDFADDDNDPSIDCLEQSHGTAVAGVAAGNGGGVLGTAPDANIVMLKVQSANLCGQPALDGDLVGAIDWAVSNRDTFGIRIISMSLGSGGFTGVADCEVSSPATRNAVAAAVQAGLVVLAASGNDGFCDRISRPACMGAAISVGAVYDAPLGSPGFCVSSDSCAGQVHPTCAAMGRDACFDSNNGADRVTCYSNSAAFLDILAPSNCATSAAPGGGTTDCFGGTSSATPFAAGVAASLINADASLDNTRLRTALRANGVMVTDAKSGVATPRVDALAALPGPPADSIDLGATEAYSDQDGDGSVTVAAGGSALLLEGNRWQRTTETFTLNAFTALEFDFQSGAEGEIHGIGFDEDDELSNQPRIFQVFGTQTWNGAIQAYDGDYTAVGDTLSYRIPVGGFYRGSGFRLVLVNDKDAGAPTNSSRFENVRLVDNPPSEAALNFNALTTGPYSNQDSSGSEVIEDAGATLALTGNRWRRTGEAFTIGPRTLVAFEFASGVEGEIHGLGFDENQILGDGTRIFRVFGSQNWDGDIDWFGDYSTHPAGAFVTYVIPVGRFYSGAGFHLVLVNDKDAGTADNSSRFRNLRVYDLD